MRRFPSDCSISSTLTKIPILFYRTLRGRERAAGPRDVSVDTSTTPERVPAAERQIGICQGFPPDKEIVRPEFMMLTNCRERPSGMTVVSLVQPVDSPPRSAQGDAGLGVSLTDRD